ncbi:MAG: hypothetical protein QXW44_00760 [Pyrobaculum sp.]
MLSVIKTMSFKNKAYIVRDTLPSRYNTVRSMGGGGLFLKILTAHAAAIRNRPTTPSISITAP